MIELYIENKQIDITDDLEINFTYESIDPDKLSSIKNSFSKTVNIPGTAANNITFGHIFRYDKYIPATGPTKIDSHYDPHKRVNWFMNKNGAVINRGYCTLDNIIVKNERDITYQLTLYGGIGEFFYSLTYNEDGSPKTLYDMYWNWRPKTTLIGNDNALEPGQENSNTLLKCSADIVASSYHTLNPLYAYEGTTDIEKDVVFVPCYTGLYEDFDSKHMLVSTFNQRYNPGQGNEVMSTETKNLLSNSFPDVDPDDNNYTTIDKNFSSTGAYRYGLVTFSRDIDPFEAGDLRVNELPVAIRLSKLMAVISNPLNNGGYEVEWDDDIKQSYHWLYSWILLGKIRQDKEDLNLLSFYPHSHYDGYKLKATYKSTTNAVTNTNNYIEYNMSQSTNSLEAGTYCFSTYVNPKFTACCASDFPLYSFLDDSKMFSGSYYNVNYGNTGWHMRQVWNMNVVLHRIYSDSSQTNLTAAHVDIFYFTQNEGLGKPHYSPFGYNIDIKNSVKNAINSKFSLDLTTKDVTIHNCNFTMDSFESPAGEQYSICYFSSPTEKIKFLFTQNSSTSNFSVKQDQILMFSVWQSASSAQSLNTGIYGEDDPVNYHNISFISTSETGGSLFSCISSQQKSMWVNQDYTNYTSDFALSFEMNEALQNGVLTAKNSGFNIISLDKKTLFANSESPMKYLSGYCKLMNYKFICDETEKKIQIKPLKKYYINRVINLDERVDLGRDINIKNVTTKYKTLNIGLESADTYPIYLFNKMSREKFNIERYDTGIEYNAAESSLLNDLVFKNTLDWQQSSIFYNIYPQFPRAYDTMSISWTLFDTTSANVNEIKKKEIFTAGAPSNNISLLANVDFLPKIALFDKDNKAVDFSSSLIFLNGFVKNYDYTEVVIKTGSKPRYVISPRVSFSNDMYEQYYLNQERCYMYDFKYSDVFTSWGCYSNDQKGTASSWVLPMFSRDLYNAYIPDIQCWNSAAYKLASWNFANQPGLDNHYDLIDTDFIYNTNYNYLMTTTSTAYTSNEYKINEVPQDYGRDTDRIYYKNWEDYLDDLYDRNARDVTAYVDLSGLGDAKSIMRHIYSWNSHLWIMTKLYNFKIAETTHDKFTKVTMHKIKDLRTWTIQK